MRALVISGGGSKGAFAGGVAEYLINECGNDYDLFVGSSTGSLLVSHLALGKIEKIKRVFTSVTQKDIFNISPFRIKKRNGINAVSINHINTLRTFIMRRSTFGESKNLRRLLRRTLTRKEFNRLRAQNEKIFITVSNITKCQTELKCNMDNTYEDFIDWIWASSNYVPFMSLLRKDECDYADGGFGMHTPIQAAITNGATVIDVIVLEQEHVNKTIPHPTNAFHTLMQVFEHMTDQIYRNDITIGNLRAKIKDVKVRFYHLPRELTSLPLIFDPVQMAEWWEEGFEYAKNENPIATIIRKES